MGFVDFDKFGMAERPVLTLAYPQGKELGQLGAYENLSYDVALNSYSTISFDYPYYASDDVKSNLYGDIHAYMLIKAGGLGDFIVSSCEETNNGAERRLSITANSAEYELCRRKINVFDGTYKFYDPLNPEDSIMGALVSKLPTWSIGYVSADLWNKYRTFEVPDSTLYDFLMNDVSETYECLFRFDTINRTINAYTIEDVVHDSDIYVGYENFLKSETITEVSDNITTVMSCYGGDNNGAGNVNIASVNPLGSVFLYNFGHFKHMMSDGLQEALNQWEALYAAKQTDYAALLTTLKEKKITLIAKTATLKDAQTAKTSAEDVQAAMISGGQAMDAQGNPTPEYQTVTSNITAADSNIANIQAEIKSINEEIDSIKAQQLAINNALKFDTAGGIFTDDDLAELEHFKFESTHQDDNFIITDVMDLAAQQDMIQQLYDQCYRLMEQASYPTYNITADAVNFLFIDALAPYINQIFDPEKPETYKQLLATKFHLEVAQDEWIDPVLLKFHVNFDNPTDFSMEFSNKYRLNDVMWTYSDLIGEAVSSAGNINFDYSSLKSWETYRNSLVDFANGSLDATKNKLVNDTATQTLLIDKTGLRASNTDNRNGIWLTSDTLAFSDDNFETVRTAIGRIPLDGDNSAYGVNAEVLIGKAIFGSQLTIANENNTMVMDGNGLLIQTSTNRIMLNPDNGILIQKKLADNTYQNQMYADANGNLVLAGGITATDGTIGGFNISSNSISSPNGNIQLRADGTGKIGMMDIGLSSTTFNGNIYAKNIQYGGTYGTLSGSAITSGSIFDSQIAAGTISDAKIASGTITSGSLNVSSLASSGSTFRKQFDGIYCDTLTVQNLIAERASIKWLQGEPTYHGGYYVVTVNGTLNATTNLVAENSVIGTTIQTDTGKVKLFESGGRGYVQCNRLQDGSGHIYVGQGCTVKATDGNYYLVYAYGPVN